MDSVKIDLKSENTLDQKLVTREKKSKEDKKKEKTDKKPTEEKKTKDYNPVTNIKNGSEIIAINNLEIEKLLKKYEPLITSDGYNTPVS